jgi:predicted DNA binding CopG/RHH family protein
MVTYTDSINTKGNIKKTTWKRIHHQKEQKQKQKGATFTYIEKKTSIIIRIFKNTNI